MKPRLGPQGVAILRLLEKHGPLTPRQAGGLLHPDAQDGLAYGADGATARSTANRAAGTLLGSMARAGWVTPLAGARYAVAYALTAAGRETLATEGRELEADPLVSSTDPVPEGRKRCQRCGRARLLERFHRASDSPDGLDRRCARCGAEQQNALRSARIATRDTEAVWAKASKPLIVARVLTLLRTVRQARRVGTWRGREGIQAYAALGEALDAFAGSASKDLSASADDSCDPDDESPPHHADPADADWSRARHSNRFEVCR